MKKKERRITAPASVLKRIAAFIVDMIILEFVLMWPFRKIFTAQVPTDSLKITTDFFSTNPEIATGLYISAGIVAGLAILYFAVLEWKFQQTIGKMIFGLYVTNKKRLNLATCIFRNIFLIPFFPFILLLVTEPLFMIFTKEHQRLLEIITKTKVVEYYKIE